jgi:hypothetical protein
MLVLANTSDSLPPSLGLCAFADQWDVQETIKRIVSSLEKRKYAVWFDLNDMKGGQSIVDSAFSGQYVSQFTLCHLSPTSCPQPGE